MRRHQGWIYNIALRMVYLPQDADDVTQEVLVKVLTKLSTFEERSSFRTWLYRITANHILNMKRRRLEEVGWAFERYGSGLSNSPDLDLPDPNSVPVDVQLLVDEARIGCSSGMLLCLDREQRLVYILGAIFGVSDAVGAELLEISRDNFRQKAGTSQTRPPQLHAPAVRVDQHGKPVPLREEDAAFMRAGYIDPKKLLFARSHVARVREVAPLVHERLEDLDGAYAEIHRDHRFTARPTSLRRCEI